jgi:hypothetical protein
MRSSRIVSIAVVAALMPMMWATPVGAASSNPCGKAGTTNHQKKRALDESAAIAANLVNVRGYCYVDVPAAETLAAISVLRGYEERIGQEFFSSLSLHSVISKTASQNTASTDSGTKEVGFLQLYSFAVPPPAGIDAELAQIAVSGTQIDQFQSSGTSVLVFENPGSANSRYYYTWLRHGVAGAIDGATRAPLERWVKAYLEKPALVGTETSALSKRLVPVSGFAYVNFSSPAATAAYVKQPIGKTASSIHQIVDSDGAIGSVVLAKAPTGFTTQKYVSGLSDAGLQGFTDVGPVTFGSVTTEHLTGTSGQEAYAWVDKGIAGVMLTKYPDPAATFLNGFLA